MGSSTRQSPLSNPVPMAPLGRRAGSGCLLESQVNLESEGLGLGANFFDLERNRWNRPAFLCRVTKQPCLAVSVAFGGSERGSVLRGRTTDQLESGVRSVHACPRCGAAARWRLAQLPLSFIPAIVIGTAWQVDPLRIPPLPRSASHQNPAWRLERERPSSLP